MRMTFRWFGAGDPVPLQHIRQIPGVRGIVSALYDVAPGDAWTRAEIDKLGATIDEAGLELAVIESVPVHEDIKLGKPARDRLADNYAESIRNIGEAGVGVLCYNFMPVFDWTRTSLAMQLEDGSTALAYDDAELSRIDLSKGTGDLPGWAAAYDAESLARLFADYSTVGESQLWDNLAWFLERIVPAASSANVKLAIHPDDPPWPIFGLPRIIVSGEALERVTSLVDDPCNGVTLCTGSLGAEPANDVPEITHRLGSMKRIHFAHCRNVKFAGERSFHETAHPTEFGDVNMLEVLKALSETGFDGPMRPDHGRMIWGETGRPGYGLHDRALGAMYLQGLWEGISR
jgi:mannonate dehydratase